MNDIRRQVLGAPHAFAVLGVHAQSSAQEMREARRRLAMTVHPDLCKEPDAASLMAKLNVALRDLTVDRDHYVLSLGGRECPACGGRGARSRQVSFAKVVLTVCAACRGSGREQRDPAVSPQRADP